MADNEKTSDEIGSLAAAILGDARYNEADVLRLAGSVLSQMPDRLKSPPTVSETARRLFASADGEVAKPEDDADLAVIAPVRDPGDG